MHETGRIVLASASPRRRDLLSRAGLEFEVLVSEIHEEFPSDADPARVATGLAEEKARDVAKRCGSSPAWILGADTVVAVPSGRGFELLGKPADEAEARAMLARLSGTRHQVVSGLCVVRLPGGGSVVDSETTWVTMRAIEPTEIDDYVRSGEWRDKAGGYAIQETADRFVVSLDGGGFDNVVGLPVERALALLRRAGHPVDPARRPDPSEEPR